MKKKLFLVKPDLNFLKKLNLKHYFKFSKRFTTKLNFNYERFAKIKHPFKFAKIFEKIQKNETSNTLNAKRKLKISQKLHLVCAIAVCMNVLMLAIVLGALQTTEQRMQSFYDIEYKNSIQQMQIRNDVVSLEHTILSAVFSDDYEESNKTVDLAVQKAVSDINILKKSFSDEQLMKELNVTLNEFLAQEMKVMSYVFVGQTEKALDAIHGEYKERVDALYSVLDTVSVEAENAATTAIQETVQQRHNTTLLLIAAMAMLGLILLFAAGMLEKTIRKATQKIIQIADCIEKGHLDISGEKHQAGDELDDVICSCEQMALTLQVLIQDVGCMLEEMAKGNMVYQTLYREYYSGDYQSLLISAENMQSYINYALNNVDTATQRVEGHVKDVLLGAQNLSNHAVKQDESITQLSDTLGIISNNSKQNAEQIQKISQATLEMNGQVAVTRQHMSETTAAIMDVSAHASKIKKIINTVDGIAFQTDILALNAAIEAARAGAAGRGFSVVAGEVRALAQKVTEAAKETAELIDNSLQLTNKCKKTVSNTADSLDLVVNGTNDITEMISEISKVVKKDQEDIRNISGEAENIRHIVRMNTETAQQFAYGSEDGYQQVNILKQQMKQFVRQEVYTDGNEKIS
ncbi:MAG: methyl-accepting chemotaxis protein [Anaerotignum sp.]|nr:methyl-accepting chemotaxis protein [Anaerotignum sp.]